MMGGAAATQNNRQGQEHPEPGQAAMSHQIGAAGLNATLHSSSQDPASTSLAGVGAAASSFKLPNITRGTHFSQAGAPASHAAH